MKVGGSPLQHLSLAAMGSLSALCDTIIPSCIAPVAASPSLHPFYQLSASEARVPEHVVQLAMSNLSSSKAWTLTCILWLLSSGFGTFLLFGRTALSWKFPYLCRFSCLPLAERERLLLTWAHNPRHHLRLAFRFLKGICLFSFYTKVEYNHNPTWSAIGYCGADPEAVAARENVREEEPWTIKPLRNVINAAECNLEVLSSKLQEAGLAVMEDKKRKLGVRIKCDVVVVGSGCGGGVCAGTLAQSGLKVVVLEKGQYIARKELCLLEGPSIQGMYERGGILGTESGEITIMAGSTVGGGTAINWGASFPTPPHILKEWAASHKLSMFMTSEYNKAIEVICSRMRVHKGLKKENISNTALRKGCERLGYHVDDVPLNSGADHYCGWCGFGCWNGQKQATSETWLVDATVAGAVIIAGCRAREVMVRKRVEKKNEKRGKAKRAIGVMALIGNSPHTLLVDAPVTILASGSLNSPCLLLKSGLQNGNIGRNLSLHVSQTVWGCFPEGGEEQAGLPYEGTILSAFSKPSGAESCGAMLETPSIHPGGFASSMPWMSGFDHKHRMTKFGKTVHLFALVRDRGNGVVSVGGDINYRLDEKDEESLQEGGERALRVLIAAGAEEVGTFHVDGDRLNVREANEKEVEEFLRQVRWKALRNLSAPLFSGHQMGSCRMGVDPETSVVDGRGETWEVEGLFVADASVLPTALGVNPMVTVQAIAYCISHRVLEYVSGKQ